MAANVLDNLANWSATEASNQPDGTDTADIDAEFRRIQAVVRKYMRSVCTIARDSSVTLDLATATGDYVIVTGTDSVESLGTVSAGMRFILYFTDAIRFVHSSALLMPYSDAHTFAAGDLAIFESLGSGDWQCIFASGASTNPEIHALESLTSAANKIPMFTGLGTATTRTFVDEDDMASNSDTAIPSQQSVVAYCLTVGVGGNQSWGGASRSVNTEYTNNKPKPIMVSIIGTSTSNVNILCGGATVGVIPSTGAITTINFIVPAGATYKWDSADGTISNWVELD